jgi:DNA-binding MarR family transcriptional regulator
MSTAPESAAETATIAADLEPADCPASAGAAEPSDDGDLASELMAFVGTFERWSDRRAAEAGVSVPRMKLLNAIKCQGPQKMADLAGRLETTPRNVTAIVDALEAEGLVRRKPHPTDRRVTLVELTCNEDKVAAQFGSYQRSVAALFADLDETERRLLRSSLALLRTRMRPDGAERRGSDD